MNAAFLILSTAALAGADPAPPAAAAPAAPVVVSGAGCSDCGAPAAACCKPGLFDKIKSRFSGFGKKSHSCGCAPACAPAPAPCGTCDPCASARPNLFDKLKSRMGGRKHGHGPCCDTCGATTVGGCATPLPPDAAPVTPPSTTTPPKVMPKPDTKPVDPKPVDPKPKTGNTTSAPVPLPAVPTVNGASGTSPY